MTIDGWKCEESYPGTEWRTRTASRKNIEWEANSDGIGVEERTSGYTGASGVNGLPANVAAWLLQAVRG